MRVTVFVVALLTATMAIAQSQPKLEIGTRQGNYYWVVETAADGTRRGGWVAVNIPLDAIDRSTFKPLPQESTIASSSIPGGHIAVPGAIVSQGASGLVAPAPPSTGANRPVAMEQALATRNTPTQRRADPMRFASQAQQPQAQGSPALQNVQTREGFWFNAGLGWGSLGCSDCTGRVGSFSGGLSAGGAVSPRVLLGVGTSGWYKSEEGVTLTGGTFDGRIRFYPVMQSGFFLTGGLGLGHMSVGVSGFGSETEYGVGALFGLGWDIRVGRNVSLTPFYNGFAVQTANVDANVAQIGLGLTIH